MSELLRSVYRASTPQLRPLAARVGIVRQEGSYRLESGSGQRRLLLMAHGGCDSRKVRPYASRVGMASARMGLPSRQSSLHQAVGAG